MSCYCTRVDLEENVEPLENLLRFVAPVLPEVPHDMMLDRLRVAYTEFARRSKLLVAHQTLPIQKGVRVYELEPPPGYEVYALLSHDIHHYYYTVYPTPHRWFLWWGRRIRMLGTHAIELEDEPSRDDVHREIVLHVLPNHCAETIPMEISTPFGHGIALGAQADLFELPNKGWTNLALANNKRMLFNRAAAQGLHKYITNNGAVEPFFKPVRIL